MNPERSDPRTVINKIAVVAAVAAMALAPATLHAAAVVKTTIYSLALAPDGIHPQAPVATDAAGNLYGTTFTGGTEGYGTVFELSPPRTGSSTWTERVLHSFGATTTDGQEPVQPVTLDAAGNIYGTTPQGGPSNAGIAFELVKPADGSGLWSETLLYAFTGGADGGNSYSGLVIGPDGALYGTTAYGGTHRDGTVFRLAMDAAGAWRETVLHNFSDGADGGIPYSIPCFDSQGNLYGTTLGGGTINNGTVFRLAPPAPGTTSWTETVLYSFAAAPDGVQSFTGVVIDPNGNLFGTTNLGGTRNDGTVFEVSPPAAGGGAWSERVIYNFDFRYGASPGKSELVIDKVGGVWGTTQIGGVPSGTNSHGEVFRLKPSNGSPTGYTLQLVHVFQGGDDGDEPEAGLLQRPDGTFVGTTFYGGPDDNGTVFTLTR
jgi:uncharacterized repeat protein (TIGR03803 family)